MPTLDNFVVEAGGAQSENTCRYRQLVAVLANHQEQFLFRNIDRPDHYFLSEKNILRPKEPLKIAATSTNSFFDIQNKKWCSFDGPFFIESQVKVFRGKVMEIDFFSIPAPIKLCLKNPRAIDLIKLGPLVGKMGSSDCFIKEAIFFDAMERQLKIEISDKSKSLRMVFMEFDRILGHVEFLRKTTWHLGNEVLATEAFKVKGLIRDLLFQVGKGHHFHGMCSLGGVTFDINLDWINECFEKLKFLLPSIEKIKKSIECDEYLLYRTKEGPLADPLRSLELGASGTLLRATGVNLDLRLVHNLYLYKEIDFEVPLGIYGGIYDQLLVKIQECEQSFRIVEQILDHLPTGSVFSDIDLREDIHFGAEMHYHSSETSRGEYGIVLSAAEGESVQFDFVLPSFHHLNIFKDFSIGKSCEIVEFQYPFYDVDNRELRV